MSKVSLKVVVAGRTYPLTVQETEVEKVQHAADDINKAIKQLQDNFAVRDMQDLLAMTALQLSTRGGKAPATAGNAPQADFSEATAALKALSDDLDALN
ncbi:cell division protein ZapA [Fluviicola chungangensis]|uniref:Cell division protein ZapA n=1 Tax=Fluviicola chungangensis TaxID=2597671 RepID=A0A556N0G2_9FLAO|nr:cell division protein ZapA [Fluviicola chungangensis]TSJ45681.1 cell division protein ZapA [Fluviicola chungangensis]